MIRSRALLAGATLSLLTGAALATAPAARAAEADAGAVQKPVKTLISAVRYGKDQMGLGFLHGEAQGRALLGDRWGKSSEKQRDEFVRLFHQLFSAIAFPKIRSSFEHLETILYEDPKVSGESAELGSTIVILHPMKKQEIQVTYDLRKAGDAWKVVDVTVKGDKSMLTNIRKDQIVPLLEKGGVDHVLDLMRKRVAQVDAAAGEKK